MSHKKIFCNFSGDDYALIKQCDVSTQKRFASIGLFISLVFILCLLGCLYTFDNVFHNNFAAVFISLFFSVMIVNIYLFMLYTLSKNVLPNNSSRNARFMSTSIRIGFICFIAIMVSKGIEAYLYANTLEKELITFKKEKLAEYEKVTDVYFSEQNRLIETEINRLKFLKGFECIEIKGYRQQLMRNHIEKVHLMNKMSILVLSSDYYIQSIIILGTRHPECWGITLLIILLFLVPAYLKMRLPEESNFYIIKKQIESHIVTDEYLSFKSAYQAIMKNSYHTDRIWRELYVDSPFNTVRITDNRDFSNQDKLIAELYHDGV